MITPSLDLTITRPSGWRVASVPGATVGIEAEDTEGQRPTLAVFVRRSEAAHDLVGEADRIVARSGRMPFHPLAVTECKIDDRSTILAAGLRQHERLGVQFQTVAVTRAAGRTVVVTGLCSRADAPAFAATLRDITHSLRIRARLDGQLEHEGP